MEPLAKELKPEVDIFLSCPGVKTPLAYFKTHISAGRPAIFVVHPERILPFSASVPWLMTKVTYSQTPKMD